MFKINKDPKYQMTVLNKNIEKYDLIFIEELKNKKNI